MESYDAGSRTPSLLEETTGASFERTVSDRPDHEALVEVASGRRWTGAELDLAVDDAARGLRALGVERGDRVGIWGQLGEDHGAAVVSGFRPRRHLRQGAVVLDRDVAWLPQVRTVDHDVSGDQ